MPFIQRFYPLTFDLQIHIWSGECETLQTQIPLPIDHTTVNSWDPTEKNQN